MQDQIQVPRNQENEKKMLDLQIFEAITENNVKQINQYLDQGADINVIDTNNNNNTPLHVAAITGNLRIFKLLLSRGANYNITNYDNQTVIDIIESPNTQNGKEMTTTFYKKYGCIKRKGTSGVKGELYETKLLSLILIRALNNTKEFILGTNLSEVGAFDDIVLRYKTNDMENSKLVIIQTKHRENENWSAEYILKLIYEYHESYFQVRQKLLTDNNNILFEDTNSNIDCQLVIYTSAKEYVTRNKNTNQAVLIPDNSSVNSLIKTSENGKVFKFQYEKNYFDKLVAAFTESRIKTLGKTLAKYILRNKFGNIMTDELLKTYRVFLAENVIQKCNDITNRSFFYLLFVSVGNNIALRFFSTTLLYAFASILCKHVKYDSRTHKEPKGQFRSTFLMSDDKRLQLLKHEICKEIVKFKGIKNGPQKEIEKVIKSITFNLPDDFVYPYFQLRGNETIQQTRLDYLFSIFRNIFLEHDRIDFCKGTKYIYVKLDDSSVGANKSIKRQDLQISGLAGLIGNFLIHDSETEMLKINMNEQSLSNDNTILLQKLKREYNLSIYRFDIDIYGFPKLTLSNKKHDEKLVADFLSQVKVYTDQSKEDEVEKIIKDEIFELQKNRQRKQPDNRLCAEIFLNIHDKIQKWSLRTQFPYLTKFYNFQQEAERDIFASHSQLIKINAKWIKKLKDTLIHFESEAVHTLELDRLLDNSKRFMIIFSDEILFTGNKVYQYFAEIVYERNCIFLNVDSENIDDHLEMLLDELGYAITPKCIIISLYSDTRSIERIKSALQTKSCKVIFISYNDFENNPITDSYIIQHTDKNSFSCLSNKVRKIILEKRKVMFQGQEVTINEVLDEVSLNLLSAEFLRKIINNETLVIGKTLTDNLYTKTVNYYVNRRLSRCITLKSNDKTDFHYITDDSENNRAALGTKDIIFTAKREDFFESTCITNNESNIHWFEDMIDQEKSSFDVIFRQLVWKQSRGRLENILRHVDRQYLFLGSEFTFQPQTVKDIEEKVVVISAESGMGKSTLLTYLAINTKLLHPSLWIIKINLVLETNVNQFDYWNEHEIKINLIEVIKFLYTNVSDNTKHDIEELTKLINVSDGGDIYLSECNTKSKSDADLSEIKLFNYFYNNNKLAILFDGFDEICPDYANEVIQLLCVIKTSKVAHLWITSRPDNALEQLESALGSFSFRLCPLTMLEQRQYLRIVWHQKLELQYNSTMLEYINTFISLITNELTMDRYFISLPLHLYMFAEIYQNDLKDFIEFKKTCYPDNKLDHNRKFMNITMFYEKFTNKKFDIQFGEKNCVMNSKNPVMKEIKESKRKQFLTNHKKLAAYYFSDRKELLSKHDIENIQEFIKKINSGEEKTGIIEGSVDNYPKFNHITFAEYFAVEFIFDKIKSNDCTSLTWKHFINNVLVNHGYGLRTFINGKLQTDQSVISHLKHKTEHLNTVYKILLFQLLNQPRLAAIYLAIEEDLEHIYVFFIECLKLVLVKEKKKSAKFLKLINEKCGSFCIFCFARTTCKLNAVKCLKDFVTAIGFGKDFCDDSKLNQLTQNMDDEKVCVSLNSLTQDRGVIDLIVEFLSMYTEYWSDLNTAHWRLGRYGYLISFCLDYLLKCDEHQRNLFFTFTNYETENTIQYVHKGVDTNFYTAIDKLLGKDKITYKNDNMTYTGEFSNLKYVSLMLKNILSDVYTTLWQQSEITVELFVHNELPALCSNSDCSKRNTILLAEDEYKKKLVNLTLLRALCDNKVTDFLLAKHLTGTFFDDIILRYKVNNTQETKMIFVKIMYKESVNDKNKTFSLERCLQSYLFIKHKFCNATEHEIVCQGSMNSIDCKFIVYNTANKRNNEMQVVESSDEENIMITNKHGKLFQYIYKNRDIDILLPTLVKLRAIELAKTLSMYINSSNSWRTMMEDKLIKTYHVFLAQKIILVKSVSDDYCYGKFRNEFLSSKEESLLYMKREIYERIAYAKTIQQNEVDKFILSYSFILPIQFCLSDDKIKQEDLQNICLTFEKLLQIVPNKDLKYVISLDEYSDYPGTNIYTTDLTEYNSLASLVGSLLIYDDAAEMLKFNCNEHSLSECNRYVLQRLSEKYELSRYRFNINIDGFPKLSLNCKEYDRKLIEDFLSKLRFYRTNHANINELEILLKNEVHKYIVLQNKHLDPCFRVKCDELFFNNIKYLVKYKGLYKHNIYNTTDLHCYKIPIPPASS